MRPTECSLVMEFFLIIVTIIGENFVTRKITRGLARIKRITEHLYLGNLDAKEIGGMLKIMLKYNGCRSSEEFIVQQVCV